MKDLHLDKQYIFCGCCCINMTVYLTCTIPVASPCQMSVVVVRTSVVIMRKIR